MQTAPQPILFYDGHCALCHGLVRWVAAHDKQALFAFAPLQGATFRKVAKAASGDTPDSVIVIDQSGQQYVGSDAIIFVLRTLGRTGWARMLEMVPRVIRDWGYRFIARVRYVVFGKKQELCPLVPPELRSRFLD
jgi:predicted DCC family thiol-disulfide oxidoreductase YuxK